MTLAGLVGLSSIAHAEEDLLLEDDFDFSAPSMEKKESSWRDYFVTSLSHDQTRNDKGDSSYHRYAVRVEYEQALAPSWFSRVDLKATSFRSPDKQAKQRNETYEKLKLQQAWLQYSKNTCAHKVGQQTLIWGQVDGTFAVDDITPFDFTEQLLTDYSNVRLAQLMWVSECYIDKSQVQVFYNPRAELHLDRHISDSYGLNATNNINEDDLDDEWGGRFKTIFGKLELAWMFAQLISNQPSQVLRSNGPMALPSLVSSLSEYDLYGISANYSSGAWQFKTDFALKTNQLVNGTFSETSDVIDAAAGLEYLSPTNHNISLGIWGTYALDDDFTENQNKSTPLVTLRWSKSYLNDDLDLSLLSNSRESPRSLTSTAQATYQYDDNWQFTGAFSVNDLSEGAVALNPLSSAENEASIQIKYQF